MTVSEITGSYGAIVLATPTYADPLTITATGTVRGASPRIQPGS